ncbi:ATP-binding protein [Desulfuromonas acetexigens]|uniref:AAA family ATPase n=1 Tax=Trichloromonas acetexigens TaxID=38815 RepID=A0A550JHE6_9BACT|nr:AAA family ATPase [Desulfuromonas acetexigens]TRO82641.1 AAA family ATPase [Desulfuromonas acetexigens]
MILKSIELRNFGKFAEKTFEFRRGMNLVYGVNEAGKTTLMEAIPAVLFGVRDKERFRSWGSDEGCAAALVFAGRRGQVRIARDLLDDRVELIETDGEGRELQRFSGSVPPEEGSSGFGEYGEQLLRLLGINEEPVFRSSLFFGQGRLDAPGAPAMAGRIRSLLSGFGQVDYDRVLTGMHGELAAITRDQPYLTGAEPGELDRVAEAVAALEERWREGRESREQLSVLRDEIVELENSIAFDRGEYAKGERYLAWVRRHYQQEQAAPASETVAAVMTAPEPAPTAPTASFVGDPAEERNRLERELAKTGLPRDIPEDLVKILVDADEERKALVALQGEAAALRRELQAQAIPPWKGLAALSLFALSAGGGLSWVFPLYTPWLWGGAGLVALAPWVLFLLRAGKAREEQARIQELIQGVEDRREEAQARLAALDGRFERLGLSPSAVEVVRMRKNLPRHQELLARIRELDGLDSDEEGAEEEPEAVLKSEAVAEPELPAEEAPRKAHPEALLSLTELATAEEKLREMGDSLREREARLLELSREEAVRRGALTDPGAIEREGEGLKARQHALSRRREVLLLASELLGGAVEEFRSTYLERFATDIGNGLMTTTRGGYGRIAFDEHFSLMLPAKGEEAGWRPLEHFSRGTVDAVYLAVRLALSRHLARGHRLPLFLDDPLVNFDGERLLETVGMLENIAREHQLVFLSHNEQLLKRAGQKRWHLLSLDQARGGRNRASEERSDDVEQLHLL